MVDFTWENPDAKQIYEGLLQILEAGKEHNQALRLLMAGVLRIEHEVTRPMSPSPVPALLADIIERLERIEGRLA